MRVYLECGILAYGFVRARCEDCGASRAVAFSCKKRGFCPSCCGRRMADTAARLVDDVMPGCRCASGCSAFRTRCATASPGTASGSRPYWRFFCAWWAAGIDARRRPSATRLHDLLHDFSECAACGGRLRIIAALTDPASIQTYLEGVGLPAMPPALAPAGPRLSRCSSSPPDLPSRPVAVAGRTAGCASTVPQAPD